MKIISRQATDNPSVALDESECIRADLLPDLVKQLAVPRHYLRESLANRRIGDYLLEWFQNLGFAVSFQGRYRNVVAHLGEDIAAPSLLVGAHYDSVPRCAGADDNASALAAMLVMAHTLARFDPLPITLVAFNREEDQLLGSRDFVTALAPEHLGALREVHVLEMLGYRTLAAGSQKFPAGNFLQIGDVGDFLALVSNPPAAELGRSILTCADKLNSPLPIHWLSTPEELTGPMAHLLRSDHAPFWDRGVPAVMWTDTAEFRNPHYHLPSDQPDTLDYEFLTQITQLLTSHVLSSAQGMA